jgi:hypothetical protein
MYSKGRAKGIVVSLKFFMFANKCVSFPLYFPYA